MRHSILPICAGLLLAGCGGQGGNDSAAVTQDSPSSPAAEAPPPADSKSAVVYPGAQVTGDRFTTSDPMDRVVAWYWDEERPMRERDGRLWAVDKPERRDGGYLIGVTLMQDEDADRFYIYLNPGAGGGTEGRVRPITDEEMRTGVKA